MLEEYRTVYEGGRGEIVEKKSRFIATVRPVKKEEEALAFIEEMRKKYWDATHNCFAYVIGERREIMRCSDDGEPGGTAGKPMLDVLLGEKLYNTAVVVTRYFGGTLLGTGGLVRAYTSAAAAALSDTVIITRISAFKLDIHTDYTGLGKIQYLIGRRGLDILDTAYTDKVVISIVIPEEEEGSFTKEVLEGTNGQAVLENKGECWFAQTEQGIEILDI